MAGIAARMPNITSGPAGNECRQHDPQPHDKRAGPLGQQKAEQVLPDRDLHRAAHQGGHALDRAGQRAEATNNGTTGYQKNITQTLGINGSVTILPKMGITFQGGYDFQAKELTPASITISRDLHCWQMSFAWVPFGHYQSWSFNIGVKAASLADLKYDKSQSMFDNLY